MTSINPAIPVNQLPDEQFLLGRMAASDTMKPQLAPALATIAQMAFAAITASTSVPLPSQTIMFEAMPYSGKTRYVTPAWWPVQRIISAYLGASTAPLKVGQLLTGERDLARGLVDIAIANSKRGQVIRCSPSLIGPYNYTGGRDLIVCYVAGYDTMPTDLLEAWTELALLMWKEKDRIGTLNVRVQEGLLAYTRKLPLWAQLILGRYRRVQVFA